MASRVYWASKESGRGLPRFSEDDVVDFMVVEALVARGNAEVEKARKDAEREEFKKSHKGFDPNAPGS